MKDSDVRNHPNSPLLSERVLGRTVAVIVLSATYIHTPLLFSVLCIKYIFKSELFVILLLHRLSSQIHAAFCKNCRWKVLSRGLSGLGYCSMAQSYGAALQLGGKGLAPY